MKASPLLVPCCAMRMEASSETGSEAGSETGSETGFEAGFEASSKASSEAGFSLLRWMGAGWRGMR